MGLINGVSLIVIGSSVKLEQSLHLAQYNPEGVCYELENFGVSTYS